MKHGQTTVAEIVFVSFPFSNLSNSKLRPALVLAYAQKEDWILCQVTSKSYSDNQAIEISGTDYKRGNLEVISYVKPAKLFTASQDLIVKNVASLKTETHQKVVNAIFEHINEWRMNILSSTWLRALYFGIYTESVFNKITSISSVISSCR